MTPAGRLEKTRLDPPTTSDQSSGVETAARVNSRVRRWIEARNELTGTDASGAFDFVVESDVDADADSRLGILASSLGAAACRRSNALGLAIDVDRVTVEIEQPPIPTRSDGGAVERDGSKRENADSTAGPRTSPSRVRALVEARTDEPTEALVTWRDGLLSDRIPFSMVPGLAGVDLLVTSTAGDATETPRRRDRRDR